MPGGRALAISGVVLGAIGIAALIFVAIMYFRRRRSGSSDAGSSVGGFSPRPTFDQSVFQADKKPGFLDRMRANLPLSRPGTSSSQDSGSIMKGKAAPKKNQISKPTRLSMWPNFWKRSSDALSFKDAAPPTMPTGFGGGARLGGRLSLSVTSRPYANCLGRA